MGSVMVPPVHARLRATDRPRSRPPFVLYFPTCRPVASSVSFPPGCIPQCLQIQYLGDFVLRWETALDWSQTEVRRKVHRFPSAGDAEMDHATSAFFSQHHSIQHS